MASKTKDTRKKAPGKIIQRPISSYDHAVVALMLAGFVFGFLLYLLLIAPSDATQAVSISDIQFLREQGEIRFLISSQDDASNACQATVVLSTGGTQFLQESIDAGVLRPHATRAVSVPADIPEGKFDYDIRVSCDPLTEE